MMDEDDGFVYSDADVSRDTDGDDDDGERRAAFWSTPSAAARALAAAEGPPPVLPGASLQTLLCERAIRARLCALLSFTDALQLSQVGATVRDNS